MYVFFWWSLVFIPTLHFILGYCTVLYLYSMTMTTLRKTMIVTVSSDYIHQYVCNDDEATWFNFKTCSDLSCALVYAICSSKRINVHRHAWVCINLYQSLTTWIRVFNLYQVFISLQLNYHCVFPTGGKQNICSIHIVARSTFALCRKTCLQYCMYFQDVAADRMNGHINVVHDDLCTMVPHQVKFWSNNQLVQHIVSEKL